MLSREDQLAAEVKMGSPFNGPGHADLIAILLTSEKIRRALDAIIGAEADLTQQQYNVLRILRGAGEDGLPLLEIGERMIQQSPGMTRMMDRLEKKGLVRRVRGSHDRRQVYCTLTSTGRTLLEKLDPCVSAFDERIRSAVGEQGHAPLLEALGRIREELNPTE